MGGLQHRHIAGVVQREARRRGLGAPAILDAGCGDGRLLAQLSELFPGKLSGFDSADYGLQARDVVGSLAAPGTDIRLTEADGSWPFGDEQFDIVVSNQVCEHVADFALFCSETARVLKPDGFAVHAFPLRHTWIEPHMHLPLVHRIRDHNLRKWAIARFSQAGLGIYRKKAVPAGVSLHQFATEHADYARTYTTYRTWRQVCDELHKNGFRVSYGYTSLLPQRALARLLGRERPGRSLPPLVEALAFPVLRAVFSSTLLAEKAQDYRFTWDHQR